MMDESWDVDGPGLAIARWRPVVDVIEAVFREGSIDDQLSLCLAVEIELGLRPLVTMRSQVVLVPDEIKVLLRSYETEHAGQLAVFVPALERALAAVPALWIQYIDRVGRACFDPIDLAAAAAVARRYADGPAIQREITRIVFGALECVAGQYPIPVVREAPRRGYPTLILDVTRMVSALEVNWKGLGLRPVIDTDMVVRWPTPDQWVAWVRVVRFKSGHRHPSCALRIRSNGQFRFVRI